MDEEVRAEFRKHYELQEKIFDRLDSLNSIHQNHAREDLEKFGTIQNTQALLAQTLQSHERETKARLEAHERESAQRVKVVTQRIEQTEASREASKRFWSKILSGVIITAILAAGATVFKSVQTSQKVDEVLKTMKENGK